MSKRFTSTEKWEDLWFRKLRPQEKILFLYILDKCNLAGFYEVDNSTIEFQTGLNQSEILGAWQGLSRGLILNNNWVWIKNFLRHQKNLPLNPLNNAHKNIINCFKAQKENYNLEELEEYLGAVQGLFSPIGIGKGKGKGIGNEGVQGENKTFKLSELENYFNDTQTWRDKLCMANHCSRDELATAFRRFKLDQDAREMCYTNRQDATSHFANWLKTQKKEKKDPGAKSVTKLTQQELDNQKF